MQKLLNDFNSKARKESWFVQNSHILKNWCLKLRSSINLQVCPQFEIFEMSSTMIQNNIWHSIQPWNPAYLIFDMVSEMPHTWYLTWYLTCRIHDILHGIWHAAYMIFDVVSDMPHTWYFSCYMTCHRHYIWHGI